VLPVLQPLADWLDSLNWRPAELLIFFHLLYNSLRAVLMLPSIGLMARLCNWLLPDRADDSGIARPRHLDPTALTTPSLALANTVRETLRVGDKIETMLGHLLPQLMANLRLGLNVFLSADHASASQLLREKRRFRVQERRLAHAHIGRLQRQVLQSIETSSLYLELSRHEAPQFAVLLQRLCGAGGPGDRRAQARGWRVTQSALLTRSGAAGSTPRQAYQAKNSAISR